MTSQKLFSKWQALAPQVKSLLRITASIMFILAGTMKLLAFPAGMPPNGGTVPVLSQLGIGAVLEISCGTLILLGFFTRPAAFILSGQMALAYFQFHFPNGYWPNMNGGMAAVLYCFIWLYFSASGAGPWSIDEILFRKKI